MEKAFLNKAPTANELELLKKFLACYRDGTGNHKEADGSSRADSRQIERCFAELLYGKTTENKSYYDFVVEFNQGGGIAVRGASIKSKELQRLLDFPNSRETLRAHLEISNAAAKDWRMCAAQGLTEDDFRAQRHAERFGKVILSRQSEDRISSEQAYLRQLGNNSANKFIHQDCVFISLLYSPANNHERQYLVSSFSITLPEPASWAFERSRLVGRDSDGGVLYEWYALSGSQFKYYPKLSSRLNGTELFSIPKPTIESLRAKAARLFGD